MSADSGSVVGIEREKSPGGLGFSQGAPVPYTCVRFPPPATHPPYLRDDEITHRHDANNLPVPSRFKAPDLPSF